MKHIGHVDGANEPLDWRTHSLGMLSPHDLFIPDPGERENVDADQWQLAGWVIPDKDGGAVYAHHRDASEYGDARPAYVRRAVIFQFTDEPVIGEIDPMDVRRSEFDALTNRVTALENIVRPDLVKRGVLSEGAAAKGFADAPSPGPLFQMPTDHLMQTALTFCNERLDEHRGSISSESAYADCNRATTYIRELVRRLQSQPAPLDGLTGTEHTDLRKAVATLEAKFSTLARIQQHGSQPVSGPIAHDLDRIEGLLIKLSVRLDALEEVESTVRVEPPMTFYDHAFIALVVQAITEGNGVTKSIEVAHKLAASVTRNRANQP